VEQGRGDNGVGREGKEMAEEEQMERDEEKYIKEE
jgi:hypothetical protein